MLTVKGILSFPTLFTPKAPKGSDKPRYDGQLLFPPGDPELTKAWNENQIALRDAFPSGLPRGSDNCLVSYKEKFEGREYYDPKLADWWVLSFTSPAEQKPPVVDMNHQPILDPGSLPSGTVVYVSVNMGGYTKGTGGVGCWLNGVMTTGELGQLGRLDNKPSIEQMFAGVAGAAPAGPAASAPSSLPAGPGAVAAPPVAPAPPAAVAPPPARTMTAKAGATTYEQYRAAGWSDAQLVEHGLMTLPGGVVPSFA